MAHILRIRRRRALALLCASAWIVCPGCGSGHPPTTRVTGTVVYKGKAVGGANVMFECKTGRPAEGITDAEGRFTLTTFGEGDGALSGEHTVIISKYVSTDGPAGRTAVMDPHAAPVGDLRQPTNLPRQVIPARYTSPRQSPLHVTVTPGGDNDFRFDLTD